MAIHRIPVLGFQTLPDSTGDVFPESYSIKATNDRWPYNVFVFNDGAAPEFLFFAFPVPKNYVSAPKMVVWWTSGTVAGNIVLDFKYRAIGGTDTESLDQTGESEAVLGGALSGPSAINERMESLITLTAANIAVDDIMQCELIRDPTDANDTKADAITVHGVLFEYADV